MRIIRRDFFKIKFLNNKKIKNINKEIILLKK